RKRPADNRPRAASLDRGTRETSLAAGVAGLAAGRLAAHAAGEELLEEVPALVLTAALVAVVVAGVFAGRGRARRGLFGAGDPPRLTDAHLDLLAHRHPLADRRRAHLGHLVGD